MLIVNYVVWETNLIWTSIRTKFYLELKVIKAKMNFDFFNLIPRLYNSVKKDKTLFRSVLNIHL